PVDVRVDGKPAPAVVHDGVPAVRVGKGKHDVSGSFAGLFVSIERGLLGLPEMQISGNGSTAQALRWYHDRAGSHLPATWVISVPLAVYRLAMLAWALWISWALLAWLRWGFGAFSAGGLWRASARAWRFSRKPTPSPSPEPSVR